MFWVQKESSISQFFLKSWSIGNRTSCCPIRSIIILVVKKIGLPLRGRPILLITRMITEWPNWTHSCYHYLIFSVIAALVQLYVDTPGLVPSVQSAWDTFVGVKSTEASQAALTIYDSLMNSGLSGRLPRDNDVVRKKSCRSSWEGGRLFGGWDIWTISCYNWEGHERTYSKLSAHLQQCVPLASSAMERNSSILYVTFFK